MATAQDLPTCRSPLVDNGSEEPETLTLIERLERLDRLCASSARRPALQLLHARQLSGPGGPR